MSESSFTAPTAARIGRLRESARLRPLLRETFLSARQLIQPLFFAEDARDAGPIAAMPDVERYTVAQAEAVGRELLAAGVRSVLLFGVPAGKDAAGSAASDRQGVVAAAVRRLRAAAPELAILADVCLCQYTSHGHCGVLREGRLDRAGTLARYADAAATYAEAGVDLVAPSGMVDGMVAAIRDRLDRDGFERVGILSYAVKFASAMYGPFREAAHSSPQSGDRRGQQLDPANRREALREAVQDVREGADAIMVKPAMANGDLIRDLRRRVQTPIAAYQVSGEYAMLEAAAERGWLDRRAAALEWLTSLRRAGADWIITYYARRAASWLAEEAS